MTKFIWDKAKIFKAGTEFAFDELPKVGSFTDICRSLNLKIEKSNDAFENYAAAQTEAEKLKIRSYIWGNLNNLKKINDFLGGINFLKQPHEFQKEVLADYKSYLIGFLNTEGASNLLNEPEVIVAIKITNIKKGRKVTSNGNGNWIFI